MFTTLETTWGHGARRRWMTAASFTAQTFGVGLLLLLPLFMVEGPPKLRWLESPILTPPHAPANPAPVRSEPRVARPSAPYYEPVAEPTTIPTIPDVRESAVEPAPELGIRVDDGTRTRGPGVVGSIRNQIMAVLPPQPAAPTRPLKISHWAEGNLIYRAQPEYPALAKQARIQGTVELRAIISKTGTIENLALVNGHPMLSSAAIAAVKQWRYRPYMLNGEPVEVETEITVNFVLGGG
jgi:periplasmic protein TonB